MDSLEDKEYIEVNFDGLPGPTHNYAGLAYGDLASMQNAKTVSNPKLAALQSLEKMKLMYELGIHQAILPPQPRPNLDLLADNGYTAIDSDSLIKLNNENPKLLAACFSASAMWCANAATVSPSTNTVDGKIHITPANLHSNLHRSQEANFHYNIFTQIFTDKQYFTVHKPLPSLAKYADEGAANHSYLCKEYGEHGIELFVYGQASDNIQATVGEKEYVKKFPARQTKQASKEIIRQHKIKHNNYLLLQQASVAIAKGAFHNDVVCVGNKNILLYHELAFENFAEVKLAILEKFAGFCFIEIKNKDLRLEDAIETYLFNSQIVSLSDNSMMLVAPMQCKSHKNSEAAINIILAGDNPINKVIYVNCSESMKNGSGPACLRLRVIIPKQILSKLGGNILFTPKLYKSLKTWVNKNYREKVEAEDLVDINFTRSSLASLQELEQILQLKILNK